MAAMQDDADAVEFFLERMAIREVDGGMKRYEAEEWAMVDTRRYCQRTGIPEPRDGRYRVFVQLLDKGWRPRLQEPEAQYMTTAELAEALDISRLAVRLTVLDTGRLQAVCSVDGEPAFDREEARRYVQEARRLAQF
ncbi:hypothetical protein [Burkholderia cepacia]|uniref:hypothetical protein n=1 Tax=Burkholderia cepacia TaxID=292 RepID=UPI00075B2EB3|nr:hypothetical protein [Burkholderia cepacia]KWF99064.1 hypothetical protein WL95_00170 [Burkholderia cepacia]